MVVFELLAVWLREPALLLVWSVVCAAVVGAGRGVGLPLLFWHERPRHALWAGWAATLLTAEIFFVLFLIHSRERQSLPDLPYQLIGGGVVWTLVVAAGAWRLLRPSGLGVAPRPRELVGGGEKLGHLKSVLVSPWPFLTGMLLGALAVAALVLVDRQYFGADGSTRHLHFMAAAVATLVLLAFILSQRHATPAVGLCMLIALFAAVYGVITYHTGSRGLLPLATVLLWGGAGVNRYRLRLQPLERRYPKGEAKGTPYPPKSSPPPAPAPLLFDRLLAKDEPGEWPGSTTPEKRPLILVCTSGGGIRAAVWTAGVLGALDALPKFRGATRMITGASGGMVGAATWVAWLASGPQPRGPTDVHKLIDAVARDSLTAVARHLFFRDVPWSFWPGTNRFDRGRALEEAWRRHVAGELHCKLDLPLAELEAGEEHGHWPSLVFTPMLVEDGRRLVFSNLRLEPVLANAADWLGPGGAAASVSSVTAYHAAALFPDEGPTFPLSTAARLSAAFPYVSAAVVLPTSPRRRVVDAGYYDNYGMDLTCGWLREALARNRRWIEAHVSEVLVVQIRDNVSHLSINPESETEQRMAELRAGATDGPSVPGEDDGVGAALLRGLEGLASPPEGLLAARDSVSLFRNDAQLEAITRSYAGVAPVRTTVFEFKGEASLSWYLTDHEKEALRSQLATDKVVEKVNAIGAWLARQNGR